MCMKDWLSRGDHLGSSLRMTVQTWENAMVERVMVVSLPESLRAEAPQSLRMRPSNNQRMVSRLSHSRHHSCTPFQHAADTL